MTQEIRKQKNATTTSGTEPLGTELDPVSHQIGVPEKKMWVPVICPFS